MPSAMGYNLARRRINSNLSSKRIKHTYRELKLMLSAIKKFIMFLNMVFNYGIKPSTIIKNNKQLNNFSNPTPKRKYDIKS